MFGDMAKEDIDFTFLLELNAEASGHVHEDWVIADAVLGHHEDLHYFSDSELRKVKLVEVLLFLYVVLVGNNVDVRVDYRVQAVAEFVILS